MIEKINFIKYRKLSGFSLSFVKGVNAISGTNGTCKTSLLHLFSNSFQAPKTTCDFINDKKCLKIISSVNSIMNPKVESLTRGDQAYNDPAYGVKGPLFSVDYYGSSSLSFRRHNSNRNNRYAIKPKYQRNSKDKLPYCPVIYLGLSRLLPFGEFQNDSLILNISKKLPTVYQTEIENIYNDFTDCEIQFNTSKKMGDIKIRSDFVSNIEGVDSNTISAGEDNLSIILTALISLKYYYNSITSTRDIESILLIDELDATLHPSFQIKLLNLFREMSKQYKIQIIFTTHSMSLIEEMLSQHDNVIYLVDNVTSVFPMENPDIYKIKMQLQELTQDDVCKDKIIPLFTEDDEARCFLDEIFNFFNNTKCGFKNAQSLFYIVKVNISAEALTNIFTDSRLLETRMRSICVLDGDHNSNLNNCILALPGKESPEKVLLDYAKQLYDTDDSFWMEETIVKGGYNKTFFRKIVKEVVAFEKELKELQEDGKSIKGCRREFYKKLFNGNKSFWILVLHHWVHNPCNELDINRFYCGLKTLFKKVAPYNDINPNEWN